jgi:DNA-binding transcriptional ArsR family regulator
LGKKPQRERMADQDQIESFIGNSFRSVWSLEVLRHLAANPAARFSADELISALRISDAVVSQSVQNLSAAGLATVDAQGRVALHDGNAEQARLVRAAIEFYRKSPDKARRLIVAQASPGVTAFANAFKLRKD